MRLTEKLLGYLHRVFDKDARAFLGLRVRYAGDAMTWAVTDNVLTTAVQGGVGAGLTVDLTQHTLATLASYIAGQAGYEVLYLSPENSGLSARVLLDGTGDQDQSNGDHLNGYTSLLWAWLEAIAVQLTVVRQQIDQAVLQLNVNTGSDIWLDEVGGYFGVLRNADEPDASYGPRIIAETLRPRSNNVALELALEAFSGQAVRVTDVLAFGDAIPAHDSSIDYDGTYNHDAEVQPVYGLFDVEYAFDILGGGDFTFYQDAFRELIGRLRAAGTHLRSLVLTESQINDEFTNAPMDNILVNIAFGVSDTPDAPTDAALFLTALASQFGDTFAAPADTPDVLVASFRYRHNNVRTYNGANVHNGYYRVTQNLAGVISAQEMIVEDLTILTADGQVLQTDTGNNIELNL